MGRTNPTFRDRLRGLQERWSGYRRALRRADKPHFDRLFEHARTHADAAGYCTFEDPETALLVAALLEQEKRIAGLQEERDDLESRVETLAERLAALDPDGDRDASGTPPISTFER